MYRRIPIGMAVLASALILAHQALAIEWVDYGEVWAPDTGMISLPCVVVDPDRFGEAGSDPATAPLYKMYYSDGIYPECDAVHLATSTDGLSWSFVGAVVSQAKKPVVVYSAQGFGQGDAKYRMWFTTAGDEESRHQTSSFKMSESVDGLNWTAPLSCVDADVETPLLASGNSVAEANAWNRGSYGVLSVLFNPDGAAAIDADTPMNNRFVMYYNVYGIDPVSEEEGGLAVSSSVAMAVSADGVAWLRIGEAPVLRGIPSVTGGMVSFADVVNNAGQYVIGVST